jgi:hypothetical protein
MPHFKIKVSIETKNTTMEYDAEEEQRTPELAIARSLREARKTIFKGLKLKHLNIDCEKVNQATQTADNSEQNDQDIQDISGQAVELTEEEKQLYIKTR